MTNPQIQILAGLDAMMGCSCRDGFVMMWSR